MVLTNENKIDLNCKYPQTYCAILCHKPENVQFAREHYGDRDLRLYLSDTGVPDTIDITHPRYDSRVFGELPGWIWLSTHLRDCDWSSLNAYRRKLGLGVGNLVASPIMLKLSVLDHLALYHSPIYADVLHDILPPAEFNLLQGNMMFAYNIACMSVPQMKHYVQFIVERLEAFFGRLGIGIGINDCMEFVKSTSGILEKTRPDKNITPEYQARIGAFIMERLSTVYFQSIGGFTQVPVKLLETGQRI